MNQVSRRRRWSKYPGLGVQGHSKLTGCSGEGGRVKDAAIRNVTDVTENVTEK